MRIRKLLAVVTLSLLSAGIVYSHKAPNEQSGASDR